MEPESFSLSSPEPDPNSLTQLGLGGSAARKPVAPAPAPEELEQDMRLENELVLLVSQLDYVRGVLDEPGTQRNPRVSLPVVIELLKTVCAFAERYPEADAGGATLGKAQETLKWIRPLERQINEGGLQSLWNLFRKPTFSAAECRRLFGQVRTEVPDLIEQFFTFFSTAFHSPDTARQWTQTYGVFVTDLKNTFSKLEG